MTYTETKHKPAINWWDRINSKEPDWDEWSGDSGDWVLCATGSQCEIIPRNEDGEPKDFLLHSLGMKFHNAVLAKDQKLMEFILHAIEERSRIIITKIKQI